MSKKHMRPFSAGRLLLQIGLLRKACLVALIVVLGLPMQPNNGAMAIQDRTPDKFIIDEFEDIKRHLSTKVLEVIEEWKVKRLLSALVVAENEYNQGNICSAAAVRPRNRAGKRKVSGRAFSGSPFHYRQRSLFSGRALPTSNLHHPAGRESA